jgi:hypothetical protein
MAKWHVLTKSDRTFLKSLRVVPYETAPKRVDDTTHKTECQGDGCDCGDTMHAPKEKRKTD